MTIRSNLKMLLQRLSLVTEAPKGKPVERADLRLFPVSAAQILGEDRKIKGAVGKLRPLAEGGRSALIVGAAGTGKKTFARYIHQNSPFSDQPCIEISVAELGENRAGPAIFGVEVEPGTSQAGELGYLEMIGAGALVTAHAELA